jgi:hypothetical protein
LAPQGIPSVLALEIPASWQASNAQGPAETDPRDGRGESDLGEERIANELKLKLGIRVSPAPWRSTCETAAQRARPIQQRWLTFVHNHAKVIVVFDFFVVVTATFRNCMYSW